MTIDTAAATLSRESIAEPKRLNLLTPLIFTSSIGTTTYLTLVIGHFAFGWHALATHPIPICVVTHLAALSLPAYICARRCLQLRRR